MKKNLWVILMGLLFISSCIVYVPYEGEEGAPPSEQERYGERDYGNYPAEMDTGYFYDYLSPHGVWVHRSPYGYVWIPRHVSHTWRPYTYGRWAWTDYGWTWVSYHEWGWIPFHYGRWGWDRHLGWFWVPGTVWAPAWVTWRWGHLYVGWAPLWPEVEFMPGIGVRGLPYDFPEHYWVFIEGNHFQYDNLDRYVLPYERNSTIIRSTISKNDLTVRKRQVVNEGVDVDHIRSITRSEVSKYDLEDADRPGRSRIEAGAVKVYRPAVNKNEAAKPKTFLQEEEAKEKLPDIRVKDMEETGSAEQVESELEQEQDKEIRLLKRSQEKEDIELRRKSDDEKKLATSATEKEKVEKDYEVKSKELKKQHEDENTKIVQRHEEEKKVVKKKIEKKEQK